MSAQSDHERNARSDHEPRGTGDDTWTANLQSMLIVFIVAFIFKGFIAEVYVIPTGSMAPTLLGAHLYAQSPESGFGFPVSYGDVDQNRTAVARQGSPEKPIRVDDPMLMNERYRNSRQGPPPVTFADARLRMGDRIFVLRVPYVFFGLDRYEVVVFKGPHGPQENLIKRVIGVPDETIWLADGDVFTSQDPDDLESFQIRRKPVDVQRRLWRPLYHSDYIPLHPNTMTPSWSPPWEGEGWDVDDRRSYRFDRDGRSVLRYQSDLKPITDWIPYNDPMFAQQAPPAFNMADIRLAAGVRPDEEGLEATIHLEARAHEFEAVMGDGRAALRMRPIISGIPAPWEELATAPIDFAPAGEVTNVEFWHVDQSLRLWIDGDLVVTAEYDWSASARLEFSTGLSGAGAIAEHADRQAYLLPEFLPGETRLQFEFEGSPLTLYRVELDRDLYYRPDVFRGDRQRRRTNEPARATHPSTLVTMGSDEYFVAGDNSAASNDSRLWDDPVPWVARIDPQSGVVNQDLILGRAFYVYYPSPEGVRENTIRFVPGFGRMRFIK